MSTATTEQTTHREVLLVPHTGRSKNLSAAERTAELLDAAGITVRVLVHQDGRPLEGSEILSPLKRVTHTADAAEGCELVLVLGGDGTFLRAADLAHAVDVPVLGINLGHVGFLAEWEAESLDAAIQRVIDRTYRVEDRMTVDVTVLDNDLEVIGRGWALNEVSVENLNRRGVLDAILEVDGRPVSSFGCDGVLISTPTGSTAYALSARGPIVDPAHHALILAPVAPHTLFDRSLVLTPDTEVRLVVEGDRPASVSIDGRILGPLVPGESVVATAATTPAHLVTFGDRNFHGILKAKFGLSDR